MRLVFRSVLALVILSCACGPTGTETEQDLGAADASVDNAPDAAPPGKWPRVILMIGDGMGRGQIAAATNHAGPLFMTSLPAHGEIVTGSLSGITDSAAAATAMATGKKTFNTRIGLDANGEAAETLVELAHRRGMRAGLVSTSYLAHATPAAFSAHRMHREDTAGIAADQAMIGADIMLGGGSTSMAPHYEAMKSAGYSVITKASQLSTLSGDKVLGTFADEHLDYVLDRTAQSTQPTLSEMSLKSLELLENSGDGFFLMIEGARIDMASHANDVERAIAETIAFDDAVKEVAAWAASRDDVLLLVTADHECGGLEVVPDVSWRWNEHTNARVDIFGMGPGSEIFDGQVFDHRWVHAALVAQLTEQALIPPERLLVPDGHLDDLRHRAAEQTTTTDFGVGINQLDALWVDADERGLAIGVEGLFQWQENAITIFIDVDLGAGTGIASMAGSLSDLEGTIDAILSSLRLTAPAVDAFGADLAISSWGGMEVHHEVLLAESGARGLRSPYGVSTNLGWLQAATNFGEGVRTRVPVSPIPGEGFETFIPWSVLYPELSGGVPVGARIGIAAALVNDTGSYTSNQILPALDSAPAPAENLTPLPGIVEFIVDSNRDGVGDGEQTPTILR